MLVKIFEESAMRYEGRQILKEGVEEGRCHTENKERACSKFSSS
jgi:hypothetical protein